MKLEAWKKLIVPLVSVTVLAVALSVVWNVPYIFTLIGLSAWAFVGHLVTVDDDMPGGWSNPDGELPVPWLELAIKAIVLVALCSIAFTFPTITSFGG